MLDNRDNTAPKKVEFIKIGDRYFRVTKLNGEREETTYMETKLADIQKEYDADTLFIKEYDL